MPQVGLDALKDGCNTGVVGKELGWCAYCGIAVDRLASAWLISFPDSDISGAKGVRV